MQVSTPVSQRSRTLEFGIYRDGDNNLDASQSLAIAQALQSSRSDSAVEYTVEDTTGLKIDGDDIVEGKKRTDTFRIADGWYGDPQIGKTPVLRCISTGLRPLGPRQTVALQPRAQEP